MDKKLEILQAAVNFVCNWFDGKLVGTAKYVGNGVELKFKGYALYPLGRLGDVIIHLPLDYVTVSSGVVRYRDLQQRDVGFFQESVGNAFVHPHVWKSGEPCWGGHSRKSIVDLFVYFLNTMLYTNANADSLRVGGPTDSQMKNADYSLILREVDKQKKTLVTTMALPRDIFDTMYFNVKFAKDMEMALRHITSQ